MSGTELERVTRVEQTSEFEVAIRAEIRAQLLRKNKSQNALAEAWAMSSGGASQVLSGRHALSVARVDKAAKFLGLTAWDLIEAARFNSQLNKRQG